MSRELARRGHTVQHVFFADFQTPRGALVRSDSDPATFSITGLTLGVPFAKAAFVKRRNQEIAYGKKLGQLISEFRPDVVISSNSPLDSQRQIFRATRAIRGCRFIFWLQDLYGEGIKRILSGKFGLAGKAVGAYYVALEARMLRASDEVISISSDFVPVLESYGVRKERVHVIENWAPLDEIEPKEKVNDWSVANGYSASKNIIYSGTLGYKHNPDLLLRLAAETDANVLVFSEGKVADGVASKAKSLGLESFKVRPWVPFSDLPNVLASADILVALIEPDAGIFSVPSKVLTYTCVGRPILSSIPKENLAARILSREEAGLIAPPLDGDAFVANAKKLLADATLRQRMGANARAYAERQFEIKKLGDRFERLFVSPAASLAS